MVFAALICGAVLTRCGSVTVEPHDEKTVGDLFVIGAKSASVQAGNKNGLVFTESKFEI